MKKTKHNLLSIIYASFFSVFISVCAWICIPMGISFTLQSFGVFLTIGVLGGKLGTISITVYILLGLAGLPVFAGGTGGLGVLFGSSGGFILGFLSVALFMWLCQILFGSSDLVYIISSVIGQLLCYICGCLWFIFVFNGNPQRVSLISAVSICVLPFIIPDLIKIFLAYLIKNKIRMLAKINL